MLVVGSGASGSIAAQALTERGLEVLLLEAGRDVTAADDPLSVASHPAPVRATMRIAVRDRLRAALRGQPVQSRRAFYSDRTNAYLVNDRDNPYTSADEDFLWIRGRQLGGSLHVFGRVLMRMSDHDFAGGAGGPAARWPLGTDDLAPWYDEVERFVGLYGAPDGIDLIPDGVYRGRAGLTSAEADFKAAVEGRWPQRRVVPWRYAAPHPDPVPLGILAARATGRLETRTGAVVSRITVDERTGLADGALYIDAATRSERRITADVVVLCASTIESIRLLLNSGTTRHPDGLGNSSGLVGRGFMDHTPGFIAGSTPRFPGFERLDEAPVDARNGATGGVFIPGVGDDSGTGVRGRYSVQGLMGRMPVPEGRAGSFVMQSFGEMAPRPGNRVTVDARRKDAWGVPAARIHLSLTDDDRALMREQVRGVREMIEHAGGEVAFAGSALGLDAPPRLPDDGLLTRAAFRHGFRASLALGAAVHECGGVRMGDDPATSVLNAHNQSWDVPNLFVSDASCFPSNGLVGSTLTIMALAARTGDHIARELATGGLRRRGDG